ncbi:hypothetical protein GCM10010500_07120 [Streptomyces nigrescens]|nr:hypothetical protein GCM10010500_07120 [Streptomyces libani subsp. libani]
MVVVISRMCCLLVVVYRAVGMVCVHTAALQALSAEDGVYHSLGPPSRTALRSPPDRSPRGTCP